MREYRSRKTKGPSKRKFHHGRLAIVGRLIVLSGFLLVCGVTSTPAQTGQDSRCAGYRGQAHGLCTAAVANGCFDGVQSPDCDALTANWNERCRACDDPAPWVVTCPCEGLSAGSVVWAASFATMSCGVDPQGTMRITQFSNGVFGWLLVAPGLETPDTPQCGVFDGSGSDLIRNFRIRISDAEVQICQQSIRDIAANDQVTCPQ